jgi:hypothetical protein
MLYLNSHKKKNYTILVTSILFSFLFFYFLYFAKTYFVNHEKAPFLFNDPQILKFHKEYSEIVHHLRDSDGRWHAKGKPENYLFSTIKKFSPGQKNILLQGDSWMEQMSDIELNPTSANLIKNFAENNNFGIINGGTTSHSPSLMQLHFKILEENFDIRPNIVVAYIDQTDIGDELCRYKDKRIYDDNNNLVAVKNEAYTRAAYDYTKVYNISEIALLYDTKIERTFKLTNFFIKYSVLRFIQKVKSIKKYGWKNKNISKCWTDETLRYLISSKKSETDYFEKRLNDYLDFLKSRKYIEKIILVTFPHKNHFSYDISKNRKNYYSINVSNIVDKVLINDEKVYHLNFSRLIFDGEIKLLNNEFSDTDPASHLKEEYHASIFTQGIIELLK